VCVCACVRACVCVLRRPSIQPYFGAPFDLLFFPPWGTNVAARASYEVTFRGHVPNLSFFIFSLMWQPVLASRSRFEVTSRDRLMLQLAKMPQRFHEMVAGAFGGPSLLALTCQQVRALTSEEQKRKGRERERGREGERGTERRGGGVGGGVRGGGGGRERERERESLSIRTGIP
jgi:uncharacterized membrane protein YgcG